MRSNSPMASLLLMLVTAGCASHIPTHELTFHVIDARDSQPLSDVHIERSSCFRFVMAIPIFISKDGSFDLPPTDHAGISVARDLGDDQIHDFRFNKAGYLDASAHWAACMDDVEIDLPPTDPQHEHQLASTPASKAVTIRLYPNTTPIAHYRPAWTPIDNPPASVVAAGEDMCHKQHPDEPSDWHGTRAVLHAYRNQYGEYRLAWISAADGFKWELVTLPASGSFGGYSCGANHLATTAPTMEQMEGPWIPRVPRP